MNIANIKLPIAVIGIIVAQAFGIIWYVAQLDSTVSNNTIAHNQSNGIYLLTITDGGSRISRKVIKQ